MHTSVGIVTSYMKACYQAAAWLSTRLLQQFKQWNSDCFSDPGKAGASFNTPDPGISVARGKTTASGSPQRGCFRHDTNVPDNGFSWQNAWSDMAASRIPISDCWYRRGDSSPSMYCSAPEEQEWTQMPFRRGNNFGVDKGA